MDGASAGATPRFIGTSIPVSQDHSKHWVSVSYPWLLFSFLLWISGSAQLHVRPPQHSEATMNGVSQCFIALFSFIPRNWHLLRKQDHTRNLIVVPMFWSHYCWWLLCRLISVSPAPPCSALPRPLKSPREPLIRVMLHSAGLWLVMVTQYRPLMGWQLPAAEVILYPWYFERLAPAPSSWCHQSDSE